MVNRTRQAPKRSIPWVAAGLLALLLAALSQVAPAQEFMSWTGNFGPISLPSLSTRTAVSTGSSIATLTLNGDVEISADNSAAAQLSCATGDTLVTEYRLTFDGNGAGATGAAEVPYTSYDSFLAPAVTVTHVLGDDDVDVTLYARASMAPGDLADAGSYSATASITVSWSGL